MGWSYHLYQNAEELDIQTHLKVRHLLKLGYNVIILTSFLHMEERLNNTLKKIADSEAPTCLWISENEIVQVAPKLENQKPRNPRGQPVWRRRSKSAN